MDGHAKVDGPAGFGRDRKPYPKWGAYLVLHKTSSGPGLSFLTVWVLSSSIRIGQTSTSSASARGDMFAEIHQRRARYTDSTIMSSTHVGDGNGMLRVNLTSRFHPIHQLRQDATRQWATKVSRQSTTLKDVTVEYQRRYGRRPPKGFDRWWIYVW